MGTKLMVNFIMNEARAKANEVKRKGLEEFNLDKSRITDNAKRQISEDFEKRLSAAETQRAIQTSLAINNARISKNQKRTEIMEKIFDQAKQKLMLVSEDQEKYRYLLKSLICQGMLSLLEDSVQVRCRECDASLVRSVLEAAKSTYADIIRRETGATRNVAVTLDETSFLNPPPQKNNSGPSCLGGIVLTCQDNTILIDNTIDARLELLAEQDKPAIRNMLFPHAGERGKLE